MTLVKMDKRGKNEIKRKTKNEGERNGSMEGDINTTKEKGWEEIYKEI